ncbi:hypothetical protein LEP1GSC089_0063 [Leptospira interrogans serovar Autumnalis str. LP101]|nr:hypothetical protein LEP1GSC089_0063 [Leptospira interrogans serovar Autumnalis str. LP101]
MGKNFLKISVPAILEFVPKIVFFRSSYILGIEITTFFRKINHDPLYQIQVKLRASF